MFRTAISIGLAILFSVMLVSPAYSGCMFVQTSFRGKMSRSDSTLIATWESAEAIGPKKDGKGKTRLTIEKVIKASKTGSKAIQTATSIEIHQFIESQPGDRFVVLGYAEKEGFFYSAYPTPVSDAIVEYIAQAPEIDAPSQAQLAFFVKYMESPDPTIAKEAYEEFASIPISECIKFRDQLPLDKLRTWVANPKTAPSRLGLYCCLLGLVGDETDALLLREMALQPRSEFRLGADGLFAGYLMLSGENGLEELEQAKIHHKGVPFSETYAGLQSIRYMWTYGGDRISKDRLRHSMRGLLDRQELADLVIIDLGRWQDWSVSDKLMEVYGSEGYDIPSTKRAIARYFLTAESDHPAAPNDPLPAHVIKAKKHLKTLREKDPETVKAAEQFSF